MAATDFSVTHHFKGGENGEFNIFYVLNTKKSAYPATIHINRYPTGNCQISSIAYMNALLAVTQNDPANSNAVLHKCYELMKAAPLLILADVQVVHVAAVKQCFTVEMEFPYTSTNGSKMCLFMLKLAPKQRKEG